MTQSAHILEGLGFEADDLITVWFSPFKMQKGDMALEMFTFARGNTEILLSNGNPMTHALVPGQEVDVTFTYRMAEVQDGSGLRVLEIISVEKIKLKGKMLRLSDDVSVSGARVNPNTFLGTVLTINSNSVTVFIEGGLAYYNDFEFVARGQMDFKINNNTKILNKTGKSIKASELKPGLRVEILERGNGEWLEQNSPPMYIGGTARTIQVLEHGTKWSLNNIPYYRNSKDHTEFDRGASFVVEKQLNANELLVLRRTSNEWYQLGPQKAILRLREGTAARYQPGQSVLAYFKAVNNKANPAIHDYVTIASVSTDRRWTAQEISGVFGKGEVGKPEGITLTVPAAVNATAERIRTTWKNDTDTQININTPFILERKTNGKWSLYHEPDRKPPHLASSIRASDSRAMPRSKLEVSYPLRRYTDKLPSGTYRIVTRFIAEGYMPHYVIYSNEFTVK